MDTLSDDESFDLLGGDAAALDSGIYSDRGGMLVPLTARPYASEASLQELLARNPVLLNGDGGARRWLLVKREMSIPGTANGSGRWSVDHLFLDQDGIPALVEVKRSTDTRIRREIVGQMLDYAASAAGSWPIESIRACFESTCERDGRSPEEALSDLLGSDDDELAFWQRVEANLQAGLMELVFLADVIPPELQQIVEYLNREMKRAKVRAVEVRQFVGPGGERMFTSRVLGQTAQARQAQASAAARDRREGKVNLERQARLYEVIRSLVAETDGLISAPGDKPSNKAYPHFLPLAWEVPPNTLGGWLHGRMLGFSVFNGIYAKPGEVTVRLFSGPGKDGDPALHRAIFDLASGEAPPFSPEPKVLSPNHNQLFVRPLLGPDRYHDPDFEQVAAHLRAAWGAFVRDDLPVLTAKGADWLDRLAVKDAPTRVDLIER